MDNLKTIIKYQKEVLKLTSENKIYHNCFECISCIMAEGVEFMTIKEAQAAIRYEIKKAFNAIQTEIDFVIFKD